MYGKPLAYIVKIKDVLPIVGADRIEIAQVMDYTVVVKKGEYKPGDLAMYVEIDSVLPDGLEPNMRERYGAVKANSNGDSQEQVEYELEQIRSMSKYPYFEFLRDKKFKIKSMKLGKFGVISQGILFKPSDIGIPDAKLGEDYTAHFNIKEIVQDEEEAGIAKSSTCKDNWIVRKLMRFNWFRKWRKAHSFSEEWNPSWPGKSDEENVQKLFSEMKEKYGDREWISTEKLEGQNITIYSYYRKSLFGRKKKCIGVCSRSRNLSPKSSNGPAFWNTVTREDLDEKIKNIPGEWFCRGEHLGPGIQKNIYKLPETTVRFFDFYRKEPDGTWKKLGFADSVEFSKKYDLPFVPVLDEHFKLPETVTELLEMSDKNTIFGNDLKHKREGFVLRLPDYSVSFKVKNPFYTI